MTPDSGDGSASLQGGDGYGGHASCTRYGVGGWPNGGDGLGSCGNGGGGGGGWYGGGGGGQKGAQGNSGAGGGGSSFPKGDLSNIADGFASDKSLSLTIELQSVKHTTSRNSQSAPANNDVDYSSGIAQGGKSCSNGGNGKVVISGGGSKKTFSFTGSVQTWST